jgi:hypothetical protein
MRAETFALAAMVLVCGTAAAAPLITFESPCECRDNHGKHRWAEKNDPALLPADARAIRTVTPSDIVSRQRFSHPANFEDDSRYQFALFNVCGHFL